MTLKKSVEPAPPGSRFANMRPAAAHLGSQPISAVAQSGVTPSDNDKLFPIEALGLESRATLGLIPGY